MHPLISHFLNYKLISCPLNLTSVCTFNGFSSLSSEIESENYYHYHYCKFNALKTCNVDDKIITDTHGTSNVNKSQMD